jgi:hypothetical protein
MGYKVNHIDAKSLDENYAKVEWELTKKLKSIQASRRLVKKAITMNDEGEKAWIIELPLEALPQRLTHEKVNWKKLVMEMFERYQIPMSTELMCSKLWLHCPQVPFEKRSVAQNVSAALSVLEGKDRKLFRAKESGKKGFIYGLKHFFDLQLNLKPYYLAQYRREEGEMEEVAQAPKHSLVENNLNETAGSPVF